MAEPCAYKHEANEMEGGGNGNEKDDHNEGQGRGYLVKRIAKAYLP